MSLKPRKIDFDEVWQDLSTTLVAVVTCGKVEKRVWNDRFSDVYAVCVAQPEPLHSKLYVATKRFLEDHVDMVLKKIKEAGDQNLLVVYNQHWDEFSKGSSYINYLYGYLNQQYILRAAKYTEADQHYGDITLEASQQMLEIGELAFEIWKRLLIMPLQKQLVENLLEEIHRDRLQQSSISQGVIHGVINSFVSVDERSKASKLQLTLYKSAFEVHYLTTTSDYYLKAASDLLSECKCCEYLEKAIQLLRDEDVRSRKFIHPSSYEAVRKTVEERLSSDHLDMLHGECQDMVTNEQTKDLGNMYALLRPIKALDVLCEHLEQHIKKTGLSAIQTLKGDNIHQQFVEAMLAVHSKYSNMVKMTFASDQMFIAVLDRACAAVINYRTSPKHNCRSPELLVRYCDSLLKKSAKGVSESDVEEKLNNSITIFKYLADKDIYQGVYQRMLCRRLIFRQSASMDAEEAMINRLKQTCGYEFTNKLHRMFTDMNISQDLTNKFGDFLSNETLSLQHGFSILVLQAGAWPIASQKLPSFQVPAELELAVSHFESFYKNKFNGRKLSWIHSHSTGDLKLSYLDKSYHITLGLFQMSLLLQFNDCNQLSRAELMDRTKLQEKDFPRHIGPLVDNKILLLEERGEEKLYKLNMQYTNRRTKFKIMAATVKEPPQEGERLRQSTDEDRKWQIQAAIVRIMKARKTLKHNLLIEEVIKQLKNRFSPSISIIKKAIEALIDKQYLERAPKNASFSNTQREAPV